MSDSQVARRPLSPDPHTEPRRRIPVPGRTLTRWVLDSAEQSGHTLRGLGPDVRRRVERVPLTADVVVFPVDAAHEPFWATTEDLSVQGVFINATTLPPIDQTLMLKIICRNAPPLRVRAQVVHRIEGVGFGCRFTEVPEQTLSLLQRALNAAARSIH